MAPPLIHASLIKPELGTSNSASGSFTVGGANRVLYVGVLMSAGSPPAVNSVLWNTSEAATQILDTGVVQSFLRAVVYRLVAPSAVTAQVDVALAAACSEWYVIPVAVKDCDQSTPNASPVGGNGDTIADSLVTVSSATDKLVLDFIGRFTDILNEGAGQTLLQKSYGSAPLYAGASTKAGAASVGMSWASPASGTPLNWNWSTVALSLNEVAAGGTSIGQVSDTSTAQPMTVIGPILQAIGQASTQERAQRLYIRDFSVAGDLFLVGDDTGDESTAGGLKLVGGFPGAGATSATIGQATDTSTAQPMVARQTRAIGQPATTDTAQPVAARITLAIGQPSDTSTAQPMTVRVTQGIGIVSDTSTAQPMGQGGVTVAIGQASDTHIAQALTPVLARQIAQVTTTDTAQPFAARLAGTIGQAQTTDAALPFTLYVAGSIGQVQDTSTAQALAAALRREIGQVATTDAALPLTAPGAIAQVGDTGTALPLIAPVLQVIGQAVDTHTAQPMGARLTRAIGQASDVSTAQAFQRLLARVVGQVVEVDSAQAFAAPQALQIGQAGGVDTALPLSSGVARAIGQVVELNEAMATAAAQLRAIGIAVTFDTAGALTSPLFDTTGAEAFRFDIPARSLRFDVPARALRFDVPPRDTTIEV